MPTCARLREISPAQLLSHIDNMYAAVAAMEEKVIRKGRELLHFLHDQGLEKMDFTGGHVYNYINYCASGEDDKWFPKSTVQKTISGEKGFYAQGKAKKLAPVFNPIEEDLRQRLAHLVETITELWPKYHLFKRILKNVYTLAVLSEMDQQLQLVKENSNRLPIGEFNKLVSEKLANEPAEYLFEKMGERYRHFFIDEFQDTSLLQWQNLLPLVNNAMAGGGTTLLVGDGKQSIYRWRGGDVSQFIDLSTDVRYL
ncbi:MAG: UvrD-helicase domain-containing protein [Owenweeksia sp.]|nr:UvrD-helicase domain-containing protein [Owenweeksia sp.]